MRATRRLALVTPLLVLAACNPPPPTTGAVVAEELVVTALVESVDARSRQVLLRGPDNQLLTMRVGPETRNLDQLRSGDRVRIRYREAIAVFLAPPRAGSAAPVTDVQVTRAAAGQLPGGTVDAAVAVRVRIITVDRSRNTVSFIGPRNIPRTVRVNEPVMQQFLRSLQPGDQVDVTFNEAVAISVEPAPR